MINPSELQRADGDRTVWSGYKGDHGVLTADSARFVRTKEQGVRSTAHCCQGKGTHNWASSPLGRLLASLLVCL
jgi:hypothetical protein